MGNGEARGSGAAKALASAAALLALVGVVLLVMGLVGTLGTATPNMRGFNPGQTIAIGESGMSVYARSGADLAQTRCVAEGSDGEMTLQRPVEQFAVDVSGSDFFELARTPVDLPAGSYDVTCTGTEQAVYAGPRADRTVAPGILGNTGLVLGTVLLALALALALAAFLVRRRRRQERSPAPGGWGSDSSYAAARASDPYAPPPHGQPPAVQPYYGQPGGYRQDDPYAAPPAYGHYGYGQQPHYGQGYDADRGDPSPEDETGRQWAPPSESARRYDRAAPQASPERQGRPERADDAPWEQRGEGEDQS